MEAQPHPVAPRCSSTEDRNQRPASELPLRSRAGRTQAIQQHPEGLRLRHEADNRRTFQPTLRSSRPRARCALQGRCCVVPTQQRIFQQVAPALHNLLHIVEPQSGRQLLSPFRWRERLRRDLRDALSPVGRREMCLIHARSASTRPPICPAAIPLAVPSILLPLIIRCDS